MIDFATVNVPQLYLKSSSKEIREAQDALTERVRGTHTSISGAALHCIIIHHTLPSHITHYLPGTAGEVGRRARLIDALAEKVVGGAANCSGSRVLTNHSQGGLCTAAFTTPRCGDVM